MQAALRLVRVTSELRGAVATVRWFSSGALRLWNYLRRPRHTPIDRGYVIIASHDDTSFCGTHGRRGGNRCNRHGGAEPAPRPPVQQVEDTVTLTSAVRQDLRRYERRDREDQAPLFHAK